MVYVLNSNGQPLMPTMRHGRVKHLLRKGLAKVVKRCPFTIKLLYETANHTQDVILGIDTGSGTIGAGAYAPDGSILYRSEVEVRNDIHDRMERRKKYRRNRRNRKTRYRKARFLNRKNSKRKDRLSPTVVSKLHSHVKEIEYVKSILPVTELVLELGAFDPHLLKDPSLAEDPWGYQHGPDYGYENTRAMVLERDGHKCQS